MPPVVTGAVLSSLLHLLAVLHHVQDMTSWHLATTLPPSSCPHTAIFVSSCEARERLPQFQSIRRIETPVAACCGPGAWGTTSRHRRSVGTPHHPLLGQVYQPLSPVRFHGLSTQVPCVSIGIRSGRSTFVWLRVAELLSLGFRPSRVPLVNAGQGDLTPLFMCSPLCGLSVCPVKERGCLKAGASRKDLVMQLAKPTCQRTAVEKAATFSPVEYFVLSDNPHDLYGIFKRHLLEKVRKQNRGCCKPV